jgi:hypothetical protein
LVSVAAAAAISYFAIKNFSKTERVKLMSGRKKPKVRRGDDLQGVLKVC